MNQLGYEDNIEEEDSEDELDDEDVGTASYFNSDDPHTPPKIIIRSPDRYSPDNYNALYITTRL